MNNLRTTGFKIIFARLFFILLMIQVPFEFYFVVYDLYKYVYFIFIALFFLLFHNDLVKMPKKLGLGFNKLNSYNTYVLLTLLTVLLSLIFGGDHNYLNLLQFLFKLFQVYIIYILLDYLNSKKIYSFLNNIAIVLALLAIIYFIINFLGIANPFITITFLPHNNFEGEFVFYEFPFGWAPNPIPQNLLSFRVYSYFTEPANAAYFFSIFLLYNIFIAKKGIIKKIIIIILSLAIFSTLSTGIFVALAVLAFLQLIRRLFVGRFKFLIWPFLLFILFIVVPLFLSIRSNVSDQEVLYRRALSVENRALELDATLTSIGKYIFGKGIGNMDVDSSIEFESVKIARDFAAPNNLLKYVYYFGWLFVLPFIVFVFPIFKVTFGSYLKFNDETKYYISSLIMVLVFSLSLDVILTSLFQLLYVSMVKYQNKNV